MKKYDILITVYNKEKYLRKCLDTIISQTYKKFNIIIVDDGSTDNSAKIIKEYMKENQNIYYYYKENTGVADTRNFAISKVTSPYFLFVDSDDYVENDLLEKVNPYVRKKVDVVSFSFFDNEKKVTKYCFNELPGEQALVTLADIKIRVLFEVPWGYIYRTEFFKQNKFEYLYGTEHEDLSLTPIIVASASKVTSIKYHGYHYISRKDSITHNFDTEQKRIKDFLTHMKILSNFYDSQNFSDYSIMILREKFIYDLIWLTSDINSKNFDYLISQFKEMNIYEILPKQCKVQRLAKLIFKINPKVCMIYFLAFLYLQDYRCCSNELNAFLEKMRIDGREKYLEIVKSGQKYYITRFRTVLLFVFLSLKNLHILSKHSKYFSLNYLEIVITTKCNLKCKHCANLIPLYKNKEKFYTYSEIINQMDIISKSVNSINLLRILGGEPFLHPELDKILKRLVQYKNIQKIEIPTNGTIIPSNLNLFGILKNPKICVSISNYSNSQENTNKLIKIFKKKNINYKLNQSLEDGFWLDYGEVVKQNKNIEELYKQYNSCTSVTRCASLLKGKVHVCPRSSHGMDLGLIPNNSNEYVDLLDTNLSFKEKKKRLKTLLYDSKYISACDYCNIGTDKAIKIPPAQQIED